MRFFYGAIISVLVTFILMWLIGHHMVYDFEKWVLLTFVSSFIAGIVVGSRECK
jgi:hypothetical protein